MRVCTVVVCFVLSSFAFAAEPVWTVTTSIDTPESAYFDPESGFVFVSNIAGTPTAKDGVGWISKLTVDGKVIAGKWVEGLNAPKGLRARKGVLWVTDIDRMVSIDIKSGKILSMVAVPGALFLNDPAIGSDGTVYVSDTMTSKIHAIKKGKVSTFAEKAEGPNGLLIHGDDLVVAAWGFPEPDFSTKVPGHLFKLNLKTKKKILIVKDPLGNLDGLEMDNAGNYLVSDYQAGKVYRVTPEGKAEEILSGFKHSADIGYIPEKKMILVPDMGENKISAYVGF